jgi:hypothetical protein
MQIRSKNSKRNFIILMIIIRKVAKIILKLIDF